MSKALKILGVFGLLGTAIYLIIRKKKNNVERYWETIPDNEYIPLVQIRPFIQWRMYALTGRQTTSPTVIQKRKKDLQILSTDPANFTGYNQYTSETIAEPAKLQAIFGDNNYTLLTDPTAAKNAANLFITWNGLNGLGRIFRTLRKRVIVKR